MSQSSGRARVGMNQFDYPKAVEPVSLVAYHPVISKFCVRQGARQDACFGVQL